MKVIERNDFFDLEVCLRMFTQITKSHVAKLELLKDKVPSKKIISRFKNI